ncbi:MAG: CPBP family intramembrane glutamic endopeptidase [Chloroflexota bacterium]
MDPRGSDRVVTLVAIGVTGALVASGLVPVLRWPVLVLLVVALPFARRRRGLGWAVAAGIPVAVNQAWGTVDVPAVAAALGDCTNLLSPLALWRVAEAAVVLGVVAVLVRLMGSSARELCLVRPETRLLVTSLGGAVLVAAGSLALGTLFAKPFFGTIELSIPPAAIGSALLLAVANGTLEEVIYRGVMLAWMTRVVGPRPALVLQALAFGAAHGGADFTGSPLPVMAAVAVGGLIAGIIVQRTRSLVFVIAIHSAFDVPLHPAFACRVR